MVEAEKKALQESYAQAGIKFVFSQTAHVKPIDIPGFLRPSYNPYRDGLPPLSPQERTLLAHTTTLRAPDEITIIYVNFSALKVGQKDFHMSGMAKVDKTYGPDGKKYANQTIVSIMKKCKYTASHEVLHVLLDALHPDDYPVEFANPRMLWSQRDLKDEDHGILGNKRITKLPTSPPRAGQAVGAKASPFAKDLNK